MKLNLNFFIVIFAYITVSCGGDTKEKKSNYIKINSYESNESNTSTLNLSSIKIDLNNKGIGPIKDLDLATEIDQSLVTDGNNLYKKMCITCHRAQKKFTGPPLSGILERRSPEWVMNMILNPDVMTKKDPIANELSKANFGAPMIKQYLSENDARAILEFLRVYE